MREPSEKLRQTCRDTCEIVCALKDSDDGVLEHMTGVFGIDHHLRLRRNPQLAGKWLCLNIHVEGEVRNLLWWAIQKDLVSISSQSRQSY